MNFDLRSHTILMAIAGSRCYGIHRPDSDIDIKGVAIPPKEFFMGFAHRFEQAEGSDNLSCFIDDFSDAEKEIIKISKLEGSIYDVRKFISLAAECNPNILDVLFCRDEEIIVRTKFSDTLRNERDLFISAKAKHTYSGYAFSQLKRIKSHRTWLLNPPKKKPERKDFKLPEQTLIPKEHLEAVRATIKVKLDSWNIGLDAATDSEKIHIQEQILSYLSEFSAGLGMTVEDANWLAAARNIGLDENFIHILQLEREYESAKRYWDQYQVWEKNRNVERAKLEAQSGYDCYSSDTEFLTDTGWKQFNNVTKDDRLATIYIGENNTLHKFGMIEYQNYIDRFSGKFTGELYNFFGTHTDTLVTPNHRMLYRYVEKNTGKKYSYQLSDAASLPNCFDFLHTIIPVTKVYKNPEVSGTDLPVTTYLRLMGWYLSDGTMAFRGGKPRFVRISQKKGGRLHRSLSAFNYKYKTKAKTGLYSYIRKPNKFRNYEITEVNLVVNNKPIVNKLAAECGFRKNKRIPRWIFSLSKRLKETLLDAMILGDGTIRNTSLKSIIYYTNLKGLADDVQELALLCGWETSLWGPYKVEGEYDPMYHIHINKNAANFKNMAKSKNIKKVPVENFDIVCFTVPNETLVTRRNGKISFHGNSKHAAHLVRLLKCGKEILLTGKVNVWRGPSETGPNDAEELMEVRNGKFSYDELIEWTDKEIKEIDSIYNTSTYVIPKSADRVAIDNLCVSLVEDFLSGSK